MKPKLTGSIRNIFTQIYDCEFYINRHLPRKLQIHDRLIELGITTYEQIHEEASCIDMKKSKLSRNDRMLIQSIRDGIRRVELANNP